MTASQNKKLPGSYINFIGGNSSDTSSSKSKSLTVAPITMSVDKDGNLYATYNKDISVSFELDEDANLYASCDEESGISFELDGDGNLYMLEE